MVIACAGPFLKYGEPVVLACIRKKTHYIDVTGETLFHRNMIDTYDAAAKKNGVLLVPSCGFDSLPSDIGTLLCVNELKKKNEKTPIADVDGYFNVNGAGGSGGTFHTMLHIFSLDKKSLKKGTGPFALNPEKPKKYSSHDSDFSFISYNKDLKVWNFPWLMASANTRIVRRSGALLKYGEKFSYRERATTGSLLNATLQTFGLMWFVILAGLSSITRSIVAKLVPSPGEGPSEEARAKAKCRLTFIASNEQNDTAKVEMEFGDPGYTETSKMLSECAVLIALHKEKLNAKSGFQTPASAFGESIVDPLRAAGFTIEVKK